jgi:hypothetical protein
MTKKDHKDDKQQNEPNQPVQKSDAPLESAGESVVNYEDAATSPPPGKQIHRRRPLPPIPEKEMKRDPAKEKPDKGDEAPP